MFKNEVLPALLKVATSTIAFEDLGRYLPFQTRVVSGSTFNHIQSRHAYDVKTYGKPSKRFTGLRPPYSTVTDYPEYTVSEGDTLCRRVGSLRSTRGGVNDENCPGCLAIAQGIIKRDIESA
jgi:hypothetical protein